MKRYHVATGLLLSGIFLALPSSLQGGTGLVGGSLPDPESITLENWAPYYQPQVAVAPAGVLIRWFNPTASPHSIRHDGCLTAGLCAFQSITVPPDSSFAIAPLPPGQYPYHCELHPIMRGTLIVIDPRPQEERGPSIVEEAR